jgi:lipopolysaccharide heptosyltransferase II
LQLKAILKDAYLNARKILLGILSTFFKRATAAIPTHADVHRILFIRIDRIGDLVLSTPALRSLKKSFPNAELTVLGSPANHEVILHNPHVNRTIIFDPHDGLRTIWKLILELRSHHYDIVIDPYLDPDLKTALIAFFTGAAIRIGYAAYGREIFFTMPVTMPRKPGHFIDLTLGVLKPVGTDIENRQPEIYLSESEKAWARNLLEKHGLGDRPIVGIHPGGFYPSQRWPAEYYAQLLRLLHTEGRLDPILFGGHVDARLVEQILLSSKTSTPFFVDGSFRRFASLLSCCRVLVCNNSGPLHAAVAMNIPTISFMGPTVKELWMPVENIHRVFRMNELPCIGCNLGCCKVKTHDCMRLIEPSAVMAALTVHAG